MLARIGELHDTLVAADERPRFRILGAQFCAADRDGPRQRSRCPENRRNAPLCARMSSARWRFTAAIRNSIAKSRAIADAYMRDPQSVDEALAGNALAVAAANGDAALYDQFMEHLKSAKTPEEYYSYFGALGLFPDPALTKRTFDFMLSPAVKNQDLFYMGVLFQNYRTQDAAWDLFKADFKQIMEKVDASLGSGLVEVGGSFLRREAAR